MKEHESKEELYREFRQFMSYDFDTRYIDKYHKELRDFMNDDKDKIHDMIRETHDKLDSTIRGTVSSGLDNIGNVIWVCMLSCLILIPLHLLFSLLCNALQLDSKYAICFTGFVFSILLSIIFKKEYRRKTDEIVKYVMNKHILDDQLKVTLKDKCSKRERDIIFQIKELLKSDNPKDQAVQRVSELMEELEDTKDFYDWVFDRIAHGSSSFNLNIFDLTEKFQDKPNIDTFHNS